MKRTITTCVYCCLGICSLMIIGTYGQTPCQLPSDFSRTKWRDSRKGLLTFTTTTMEGWEFHYGLSPLKEENPTWNCYNTSTSGLITTLLLKSNRTFTSLGTPFQPFLCMRLSKITEYSYYYYLAWVDDPNLHYQRVIIKYLNFSITDPLSQLCMHDSDTHYPPHHEYHIMIKNGFEASAIQDCPSSFYGEYAYNVSKLDLREKFCGAGNEKWDVCSDHQSMKFNYTTCNATIADSTTGNVFCAYQTTSGSYTVTTVYSQDSEIFSCFMASVASDGSLKVSQASGSCTTTQTPTKQPTLTNGTVVGLNMELAPKVLCPIRTTTSTSAASNSTTENSGLSAGAVAGISVGIVAVIAIASIFICLYLQCRSKRGNVTEKTPVEGKTKCSFPSLAFMAKLCKKGSEAKEPQNTAVSPRSLNSKVNIDQLEHKRYPDWIHSHSSTPPQSTASPSKLRRHLETAKALEHPSKTAADVQAPISPSLGKRTPSVDDSRKMDFETQMKQLYRPIVLMDLKQESERGNIKQDLDKESKQGNITHDEIEPIVKRYRYKRTSDIVTKEETPRLSQNVNSSPTVTDTYPSKSLTTGKVTVPSEPALSTSHTPKPSLTMFSPVNSQSVNTIASPNSSLPVSFSVSPSVDLDMETDTTIDSPKPTFQPLTRELSKHTIHSRVETIRSTTSATGILIENLESLRKSSITPVSVRGSPLETPSKILRDAQGIPDNPAIVKSFFANKEKRYSSTFLNVKTSIDESPSAKNQKEIKERKLLTPTKSRNNLRKMSDKRSQGKKGKKKKGKNALKLLERCQSFNKTPNKLGEFYNDNIPILTPHQEAKNLDLDGSISGIAYDDDNVKQRQMQNTPVNDAGVRRSTKSVTFRPTSSETRDNYRNTPTQKQSPIGHSRSSPSVLNEIIQSGCEYFLENESAVIVLNVQKNRPVSGVEGVRSVREELPSVYEDCEDEEVDENEEEDEEEDDEEDDDNDDDEEDDDDDENDDDEKDDNDDDNKSEEDEEDANNFHDRKLMTAMKITYGDTYGRDSDPDRMIMKTYGYHLETE